MPGYKDERKVETDSHDGRMYVLLDKMDKRLYAIETTLLNIVRIEERVNGHEKSINRLGNHIDDHDRRIRLTELAHSELGSVRDYKSNTISDIERDLKEVKDDIKIIEKTQSKESGKGKVWSSVLTWIFGVISAILVFKVTSK